MSKHIIEFDEKCKSCDGAGVYIGMAERDGACVICHTCKGTGCHHVKFEYEDFEGKKINKKAKWVYEGNPGIMIGTGKDKYKLSDFGGFSYKDWISGKPFPSKSENRKFTCPAWWYQNIDYEKKPEWDECIWGGSFSDCKNFCKKDKCWKRWDKEFGGKNERKKS